jgi:acetylornithine deacetylase/succinyl-diaminopimelate desuccinylase-like protein
MTETTANPFESSPILEGIRRWVEIETPTEAPEQVNKLADLVTQGYRGLPATVERIAGKDGCGDHLVARSSWGQDAPGILVLSHLDTVHPLGFIARLPFRIDGDSAFGPGIYDMKGGAYLAYHAFRQVCADNSRSPLGVTQIYVSDEEIGSPTSRALIEAEGRKAKYVLVTEPARDGGKIVTGRKGVARFEVFIKGVPSHAGSQRHPRTRQRHSNARGDERLKARHIRQCRRRPGRHQAERHCRGGLCRGRPAGADDCRLRGDGRKNPRREIEDRRGQRQDRRRVEPAAV